MNSKYPEDDEFIRRIKAGDERLLKQLFEQYWPYFGPVFLKRKTLNYNKVKEIYTFSFTQMVVNIIEGKLTPPLRSSLKVYLVGVGTNFFKRGLDDQINGKEDQFEDWDKFNDMTEKSAVEDQHDHEANIALINKGLRLLDEECRRLLTLSFLEENADDAIAAKMNIPSTGAVRQRRFKCLIKLRNLLFGD